MKIISYCIFGEEQYYKHGVRRNIALALELFPGWNIRLYAEKETQGDIISEFQNVDRVEVIVKSQKFTYDGTHWRMLPMQEGHEVVIVRDVDTTLTTRDVALVDDWLSTPYKYSVCRDEPGMKAAIMAGIWGGRTPKLNISDQWYKFYKKRGYLRHNDLSFLDKCIYSKIRNDLVVYSEFNIYEGESNIRKIPHSIEKDKDGVYQVIGMRVFDDISDIDDNVNTISEINFTRKKESGKNAAEWFNKRYDNSNIVIRKPRYKYSNTIRNEVYWACYLLLDKGVLRLFQSLGGAIKRRFLP